MLTGLAIQFDLLAQGQNLEDWSDLLIIALMAILWLGGALAKVLTSRRGAQQGGRADQQTRKRETWQERLARKAEEMQRAAEARGRQLEEQARASTQTARPPAPAGTITIRTDRKGDSIMVYERPAEPSATERQQQAERLRKARKAVLAAGRQAVAPPSVEPQIRAPGPGPAPSIAEAATILREPPQPLEPGIARSETLQESVGGFHPAAIIDTNDPDALQKAILHYEILGKPLALRGPSEETIPF